MDLSVIAVIVQLIFLEGILSIDNAAVLGAMVSHLPDDVPIIWPQSLDPVRRRLHRRWGINAPRHCAWVCWARTWAAG